MNLLSLEHKHAQMHGWLHSAKTVCRQMFPLLLYLFPIKWEKNSGYERRKLYYFFKRTQWDIRQMAEALSLITAWAQHLPCCCRLCSVSTGVWDFIKQIRRIDSMQISIKCLWVLYDSVINSLARSFISPTFSSQCLNWLIGSRIGRRGVHSEVRWGFSRVFSQNVFYCYREHTYK